MNPTRRPLFTAFSYEMNLCDWSSDVCSSDLADQGWTVASVETSGDGDDYTADIIRFCNGDKELEAAYFGSADAQQDPLKAVRTQFIREYVEANQLPIDSYQDPYWDAVPLYE